MSVTAPTLMPRKVTGEPTVRPPREEFTKNKTAVALGLRKLPPPNANAPMTSSAIAPTTKPPISFGLEPLAIKRPNSQLYREPLILPWRPTRPSIGNCAPLGRDNVLEASWGHPERSWFWCRHPEK